jgi:protein TonB
VAAHLGLLVSARPTLHGTAHPVSVLFVRTIAAAGQLPAVAAHAEGSPATAPPGPSPAAPSAQREPSTMAPPPVERATRSSRASASPNSHEGPAVPASRDAAPAAGTPPVQAPKGPAYHLAGELDPAPAPLQAIEPEYPPEAGFQPGRVVLRLFIDESGQVDRVDVLQANPTGLFENAARTAFAAARFSPGRIAGIAVKSQMTVEVEFTPINRGNEVSGRTY